MSVATAPINKIGRWEKMKSVHSIALAAKPPSRPRCWPMPSTSSFERFPRDFEGYPREFEGYPRDVGCPFPGQGGRFEAHPS